MSLAEKPPVGSEGEALPETLTRVRRERIRVRRRVRALADELQQAQQRLNALEDEGDALVDKAERDRELHVHPAVARRIRERLAAVLDPDARVLVATLGDRSLLDLPVRQVEPFPQMAAVDLADPAATDSLALIAHIEAMRDLGYDTFAVSRFAHGPLDRQHGFVRHLSHYYARVVHDELCTVYDLRVRLTRDQDADPASFDALVREAERRIGRPPTILDWRTGANLKTRFSGHAVAAWAADTLPHIDRSIDVVAIATPEPHAAREARRVATTAVVVVDSDRVMNVEWLVDAAPGSVGFSAAADDHAEDLEVFIADGVLPLPGAVEALKATFDRFPQVGVVGGRVVDAMGRLVHAGGIIRPDASLIDVGKGDPAPGHARYSFVRAVDFSSSLFMAVRGCAALEHAGGIEQGWSSRARRDAELCLHMQARGFSIGYQPDATAVCTVSLTQALSQSLDVESERSARAAFARRWRSVLQTRVSAQDAWAL